MFSKAVLVAVLSLSVSSAFADHMGPNGDKFYDEAAHFTAACNQTACRAPYSAALVYYQASRMNKLEQNSSEALRTVANYQAQIWSDTILGGDYYAAGRTRMDSVVAFFKKDRLVGFKIRYSEKAWNTSECAFNGKRDSLKGCQEGRISEESYVSPDFQTYFTDEERQAAFSAGFSLTK
ncbi:hypothetical protein ACLVWU_17130 [Bdellovibrio sp. HCB290]|uniref:hypothetical protein n=1 Tax=Bdellovibrio sp. HCB290 TaxID=3394356 RepID=UPI0039B55FC5